MDREFDARAYDQGVRDGRNEAAAEIERLRAALEFYRNDSLSRDAGERARAALGGENG